jgi:mRNA-degrading endonuclease RelE of RelBE toxin-antitoxin system
MNVAFERKAKKFIERTHQPLKDKIASEIRDIFADPFRDPPLSGNLREFRKHTFTFQGVQYRIMYRVETEMVIIAAIGTRENFYRRV